MIDLNGLLDALTIDEREELMPKLELVDVPIHAVVAAADAPIAFVHLPISCVLSTTAMMQDGDEVEVAAVGREGFHPLGILLDATTCDNRTVCQVAGQALRLPVREFTEALARYPALDSQAKRFAQGALQMMSQSIACNRLHALNARCARWLLLTHDRVPGDEFRITQEYLAIMLGVRRPAVSVAAQTLQHAGLITYRRGAIRVLDRDGLEAASCECYSVVARAFERLFAAP